jgi:hypothetical protein
LTLEKIQLSQDKLTAAFGENASFQAGKKMCFRHLPTKLQRLFSLKNDPYCVLIF